MIGLESNKKSRFVGRPQILLSVIQCQRRLDVSAFRGGAGLELVLSCFKGFKAWLKSESTISHFPSKTTRSERSLGRGGVGAALPELGSASVWFGQHLGPANTFC